MTKSILTILLFFSSYLLIAQSATSANTATINKNLSFVLGSTSDVNSNYVLNLNMIPFKDASKLESFFGGISDNLLTYSYDRANNVAILKLNHYAGSTVVTVANWNSYIAGNTARYLKIYNEFNK